MCKYTLILYNVYHTLSAKSVINTIFLDKLFVI